MSTSLRQRLTDLLATGRVANVPTVWSNVLVGYFLGTYMGSSTDFQEAHSEASFRFVLLALTVLASSLYVGGCFLNDWHDARWDRENRPERPIPGGRLKRSTILLCALFLLGAPIVLASFLSTTAVIISLLIVGAVNLYTFLHKRTAWSFLFMGSSRALLYLLGFFAVTDLAESLRYFDPRPIFEAYKEWHSLAPHNRANTPLLEYLLDEYSWATGHRRATSLVAGLPILFPCLGLFFYVLGVSLVARFESVREHTNRILATAPALLLWLPLVFHFHWWVSNTGVKVANLISAAPFLAWSVYTYTKLRNKADIGEFVSLSLAGICLVDLILILPYATLSWHTSPFEGITLPLLAVSPLLLFLFALILQRIAPAT